MRERLPGVGEALKREIAGLGLVGRLLLWGFERWAGLGSGLTNRLNALREWGRIGQGGQVRMDWFADEGHAVAALVALEAAKRRRGYWVEPQQLAMFV